MNSEKIILAFAKVKEDMTFLKTEIEKVSKDKKKTEKAPDKSLLEYNSKIDETIDKLSKSVIKIENDYKDEIDKTHRILSKLKEDFDKKLEQEISILKSDFEEKLSDIERNNAFEGEDLY